MPEERGPVWLVHIATPHSVVENPAAVAARRVHLSQRSFHRRGEGFTGHILPSARTGLGPATLTRHFLPLPLPVAVLPSGMMQATISGLLVLQRRMELGCAAARRGALVAAILVAAITLAADRRRLLAPLADEAPAVIRHLHNGRRETGRMRRSMPTSSPLGSGGAGGDARVLQDVGGTLSAALLLSAEATTSSTTRQISSPTDASVMTMDALG